MKSSALAKQLLVFFFVFFLTSRSAYAQQASDATISTQRAGGKTDAELSESGKQEVVAGYGRLPLSFEVNQGQTDEQVKFVSRSPGFSVSLTPTEAVLAFSKPVEEKEPETLLGARPVTPRKFLTNALHIRLVGGNPTPSIGGLEELTSKSNYFIGNDPKKWQTNVPNYAQVKYLSVYPGVDLVYYGNHRRLEHDFIVSPGADPRAIKLGFDRKERLRIDKHGDLVMRDGIGEVRLEKPVVYQEVGGIRQQVAGGYVLNGQNHVGFRLGKYDVTKTLVIDPVLSYSTYLNGTFSANEYGTAIAVDSAGSAYVTGKTDSGSFPTTAGAFETTSTYGFIKAFVMKLKADGSGLIYSTYLGGTGGDYGSGIAVDSAGSAYVTGTSNSADFPVTASAFQTSLNGAGFKSFVTKLNAAGSALIYSTYLGGGGDYGFGIAVDSVGSAYVVGHTLSQSFPVTAGALRTTNSWPSGFVTKLNAAGSGLIYSTYLGSNDYYDNCNAVAVDSAGFAYVTGSTYTYPNNTPTGFPVTPGAFQTATPLENPTAFVTKMNVDGSALIYSTFLSGHGAFSPRGIGGESGQGIAVDSAGSAYVTGTTYSPDFPTTTGAFQTIFSGAGADFFVTKLNSTGSGLIYSTFLGGTTFARSNSFDPPNGIALDSTDSAYVIGTTNSASFPTTSDAFQPVFGGATDAFVTKLSADGSGLVYSTYLGGSNTELGLGIAVDSASSIYVTGSTNSVNFPITPGAFQKTLYFSTGFVAKFANPLVSTTTTLASSLNPSLFGQSVTFTATVAPASLLTATDRVTFYDGATLLGSNTFVGTQATFGTSTLFVGTHSITATYSGNTNYAGSTSAVLPQMVNQASTTVGLSSSANPSAVGQAVTFTAVITPQFAGMATGNVTFSDGATPLPIANVTANSATLTTSTLAVGTHSITASYSGDTNFSASTSPALTETITLPPPAITLTPTPVGFGFQRVGTSATQNLTVGNIGGGPLNLASIQIQGKTTIAGYLTTVAGNGTGGYSGDGGAATSAKIKLPNGVAVDRAGNLFIADLYNFRIRRVDAVTGIITTVAGNGTAGYSGDGGAATSAEIIPTGVAVDSAGNLFIADGNNARIRRVDAVTGIITTVAGNGTAGYSGDGGAATSAEIYQPQGVAVDRAGNLFIADESSSCIRRVDAVTGIITTVAGNGTQGSGGDGGAATSAEIKVPTGVAVDSAGNLFIADYGNARIRRVDAVTGIITTVAGNGTQGYSGDGGTATSAEINASAGVAMDRAGNLFIADTYNFRIRRVDAVTGIITTVAGNGTAGYTGDGGAATSAEINASAGVAVDSAGNLFIADSSNSSIRRVDAVTSDSSTEFAQTNNCNSPVLPSGSCTVQITFTPALSNARVATLVLTDNDATSPQQVPLSGVGIQPVALLSPNSLLFPNTTLGQSSAAQVVVLANSGNGLLTLGGIGLTGTNPSDFSLTNGCGTTLAANTSCRMQVTFTPTLAGARSATLQFTDDASGSTQSVSLAGTGLQASTTTSLASSLNPALFGQSVTFTATVTAAGSAAATGTVTFYDGATSLGSGALSGAQATFSTSALLTGTHSITASYSGDTNFTASTSTAMMQTVNKATPTLTWTPPASIIYGTSLGGSQLSATANVPGNFVFAPAPGTVLNVGTSTLNATFAPTDAADYTTASASVSITVTQASSAVYMASSPNPSLPSQAVTLGARIVPQIGGTATGNVTFADSIAGNLGTANVVGNTATISTTALTANGTYSITATYSGDNNVLGNASATLTQTVSATQLATTTMLISSVNPSYVTQPVTFTATVMASNGTPATGTVTFVQGRSAVSTALVGGVASYSVTFLTTGPHTFIAFYAANGMFLASTSAALTQRVRNLPATTTTTVTSSVSPSMVGKAVIFTATVTSPFGPIPDGETISFLDGGGAQIGTGTTLRGVARLSYPGLTAGSHPIHASYPGDATFVASTSAAITQVVDKYTTTTTLTSSLNPSTFGQAVIFTATVTSTGPNVPTLSVSFWDGSTYLGAVALDASGVATLTPNYLPAGSDSITATYNGDSQSLASSGTLIQVVTPAVTTTTLNSSLNPSTFRIRVKFTAMVASPTTHVTGTVTFTSGSTTLGTVTLSKGGIASFTPRPLPLGADPITATYNGTPNITGSSASITQQVN